MKWLLGLGIALWVGCHDSPAKPDGAVAPDASPDAATDAAIDATVATVDAATDAPSSLPRCASGPGTLIDFTPDRIDTIALSGDTLYASVLEEDGVSNPRLVAIDLTTGTAGTAMPVASPLLLSATTGDAFASEYRADGTIWRLHPGDVPASVVQHRTNPSSVATAGAYVYWIENGAEIDRRLLAGGPVETVMPCASAYALAIAGTSVYCATAQHLERAPVTGTTQPESITGISGYPMPAVATEGSSAFVVEFQTGHIYRADAGSTAAAIVATLPTGRLDSIQITPEYIYAGDLTNGIRRVHRSTLVQELLTNVVLPTQSGPVLWNNRMYYTTMADDQGGQNSRIDYCAD